jgi:Sulfotransferase domain
MRFLGYAMIIGAMKSGTTTLHHILVQHPEIVAGVRKELNFFKPRSGGNRSAARYEAMFPRLDKTRHAYTLDSSPNYTKPGSWELAPRHIAELPGRKRLIYVLRHPIERIDSHIAHNVAQGRWTADRWPMEVVVDISAYARQLAKFEDAGLLDDVLLVDFSELSVDPSRVAYRVHDFLEIPRVKPMSLAPRNPRKVDGRFLRHDELPQLRQLLQHDVETLITKYGFEPARSWAIT